MNRSVTIKIRVTETESADLANRATATGKSVSGHIRALLFPSGESVAALTTIEARAESAGQSVREYTQAILSPLASAEEPIAPPTPPEPAAPQTPPPAPPVPPVIPVNRKTPKPIGLAKLCIACRRFGAPKWNCPKCRHLLAPAG